MNFLYYGDNLDVLRESVDTGSVDLVYLDPPFNSNRSYNVLFADRSGQEAQAQIEAFDDTWRWSQDSEAAFSEMLGGEAPSRVADAIDAMRRLLGDNDVLAYLVMMTQRLVEMHRVLTPDGTLYLHCDPTASHYLKVMLDALFGPRSFRNEVVWAYKYGGRGKTDFGKKHDILLRYVKGRKWTFNYDAVKVPHEPDSLEQNFRHVDEHGRRYRKGTWKSGKEYRYYADEGRGRDDVWTDIGSLHQADKERLSYPTQKPEGLLELIIAASSNEGDLVLDPFCGCGTTVAVAQRMRRRWVGIDITFLAVDLIDKRLRSDYGDEVRKSYEIQGIPRDVDGARALFNANPFDFERWAVSLVSGQPHERHEQAGDRGVDGWIRFPTSERGIGRAVVSVKGGRQLNPAMVRDLRGTVESQRAEMGVLVTLEQPTRGMLDEARRSGIYSHGFTGRTHPRVQIVTIPDLLAGGRPDMPGAFLPYVQAKRRGMAQQGAFDLPTAAEKPPLFDVE